MTQIIISVIIIAFAVLLIFMRNYKKAKAIKKGANICESIECSGCPEKKICDKN